MSLSIPNVGSDLDVIGAAFAYANAGWYVGPVSRGTKHPGSILGKGWQHQTSRDPEEIVAWFAGTDHGLFLHVGRSGAVVFDVDDYSRLPEMLRKAFGTSGAPFQSTRATDPNRGHYVFAVPPGRVLGNGVGRIGGGWGEIRGVNGVIVAAPSQHEKPEGRYQWCSWGVVPVLPDYVAVCLDDASPSVDAATDAAVRAFLERHADGPQWGLAEILIGAFQRDVSKGESRHATAVRACVGLMREAALGYYPAREAADALATSFVYAVTQEGHGKQGSSRSQKRALSEFQGILAWSVGQAMSQDVQRTHEQAQEVFSPALTFIPAVDADPKDSAPSLKEPLTLDLANLSPTDRETAKALVQLLATQRAREIIAQRERAHIQQPVPVSLADLLSEPEEDQAWRVGELWPAEGRVLLAAQYKSGKTTLRDNLVRCLVDASPFLGKFETVKARKVVLIDTEMSRRQLKGWLGDQGMFNPANVLLIPLRGRIGAFDILTPDGRARWADYLVEQDAEVVILDCLRPILDAWGLSEDKEAGKLLTAFDMLIEQASVSDAVVVHHMGHNGERSRGDSRLRDWPDVEWRLVREQPSNPEAEPDPSAPRFLTAYGRDVDMGESQLAYDSLTRHLTLVGGSRKESAGQRLVPEVLAFVRANQGCSKGAVKVAITGKAQHIIGAINELEKTGQLVVQKNGSGKADELWVDPQWKPESEDE